MYCSNCGKKVEEGVSFCSNCGNALGENKVSTNNNAQQNVVMAPPGSGAATASMVLGILAIIAGVITLFIAIGLSTYIDASHADILGHFSDSYKSEIMATAISVVCIPAILSIVGICLAFGSRGKIKNGSNTAGIVLNLITIIICVLEYVMITG